MATQKVSVTLEEAALEQARLLAGRRGLSSYLDAALAEKLERDARRQDLLAYLDELEAQDPTDAATRARAGRRAQALQRQVEA